MGFFFGGGNIETIGHNFIRLTPFVKATPEVHGGDGWVAWLKGRTHMVPLILNIELVAEEEKLLKAIQTVVDSALLSLQTAEPPAD